ncbi:MAG TPA: spore coat protein CotJB [Candidatus Merdivicinus intestinavium]|nr:spore coat protein CotJB [Candidatus Merdivicinus intestinavium]
MDSSQLRLLKEIQLVEFTVIEANLYLDTHPDDQEALRYYQSAKQRLESKTADYEVKYGRIAAGEDGRMRWAWVDEPWPWQMEG